MNCARGRSHEYGGARVRQAGLGALALALTGVATASAQQRATSAAAPLAFDGATVVDVVAGKLLPNQRVVVVGHRIAAMGSGSTVSVPQGARVVDARGKYLIPGLWDMHAHVESRDDDDVANQDAAYRLRFPLFIAHGVTGIREMTQPWPGGTDSFPVWQRQIMDGARVGPRAVGPSYDLNYRYAPEIATAEDGRRVVDSLKAAGMAFIKYHSVGAMNAFSINRDILFAILHEARQIGIPVVGHLSKREITNVEASDSGMYSIEHVNEDHQCWSNWPAPMTDSVATEARCIPVANAYIRNGTWITPTLAVFGYVFADDSDKATKIQSSQQYVQLMHRLGVRKFLAGSDYYATLESTHPAFRPGLSLLEELVCLSESGLTPLEVLQTATINPAQFFHATDSLGTVAQGKLADLVLLDADPLVDVRNVMKLRAVVANGRYFDRETLDAMDAEGMKLAKAYVDQQSQPAKGHSSTP